MHVFSERVGVHLWVPGSVKQGKMLDLLHANVPVVKSAQTQSNVCEKT